MYEKASQNIIGRLLDEKKMSALRRVFINVILSVAFAAVSFIILTPLLAEVQFYSAEKLITKYLWKDAEDRLILAIKTDPLNSKYPARLGEFLFTQSAYKDNPLPLLKKAQGYYERAARLNPRCAEYFTRLGRICVSLFIGTQDSGRRGGLNLPYSDAESGRGYIDNAFENFKKALADDPNGFNAAYGTGYSGLAAWKYLNEDERAFVIDRLKYSLEQKPWYSVYIYPQVLRMTESPELLGMIIPEIETKRWVDSKIIDKLKNGMRETPAAIIPRSGWQGTVPGGGSVYENGNMCWSGTIYGAMLFPAGDALIKVEARGSPSDGVYPYILVFLDGKIIGSVYVDSGDVKIYSFAAKTDGGVKVLSITFTNDGGNKKEDRNLYIGNARVEQK
ncbi:MAG: carbohydrate-binding domain-containing protein [Candidatus Omnitrophota bacterium]